MEAALYELTFPVSISLLGWFAITRVRPAGGRARQTTYPAGPAPGEDAEVGACLAKPFDPVELIATVRRLADADGEERQQRSAMNSSSSLDE